MQGHEGCIVAATELWVIVDNETLIYDRIF